MVQHVGRFTFQSERNTQPASLCVAECCLYRQAAFDPRRSLEMQMHEMIKCKQVSGEMSETISQIHLVCKCYVLQEKKTGLA